MDKKDGHTHTHTILLSHKKNDILPFAMTWMDLESIMLIEISQIETNTVSYKLHVESKKYRRLMNMTKEKHIYSHREQSSGYRWDEGRGRDPGVRD